MTTTHGAGGFRSRPYVDPSRTAHYITGCREKGPVAGVELAELEAKLVDGIATYRGASFDPENNARAQELESILSWLQRKYPEPPWRK